MIVQCPRCRRRYKVQDTGAPGDMPVFQCSHCHHTFSEMEADTHALSFSADEELRLPLEDRRYHNNPLAEDTFAFTDEGVLDTDLSSRPPEEPAVNAFSPLRTVLIFLTLLLATYGVCSLYLYAHPHKTDIFLTRLPLMGKIFARDRLLPWKIQLVGVKGTYQTNKEARRIFMISGQAINNARVPVKGIQIEGRIYRSQGEEVDRKVIFCGNVVSLKVVRDLRAQEIALLQRLHPPQGFVVPPGGGAHFAIIFLDPPTDVAEFSCRVITAQFQTSRS